MIFFFFFFFLFFKLLARHLEHRRYLRMPAIEDIKLNQYQNFQLILPITFPFMRYFVNIIIFRVSHGLLYCIFIEVDFETIENVKNIHISSKVSQSRT